MLLSKVSTATSTYRLDPEYFSKQNLADDALFVKRRSQFARLSDLKVNVDASAFYPSIEGYYGSGTLPFLRVADVDTLIDFEGCTTIPESLCDKFPTLSRVSAGDILFTKGGSIARVGLVSQPAAVSRDLIYLNTSRLSDIDQAYLFVYFQTGLFHRALVRSSSQTAQPHLTITLVRELLVFRASDALKRAVARKVQEAAAARKRSRDFYLEAEALLAKQLGLAAIRPDKKPHFTASMSEVFASGRLDAEHFQPKFRVLSEMIRRTGEGVRLGDWLTECQRGKQPDYADEGLSVVNSKHVLRNSVALSHENRKATFEEDDLLIHAGDVLINGTGVGTIGRASAYLHDEPAIPDNHVTILRPKVGLDPVYLAVFLNSVAGQWQVEQRLRGSSGQIEVYPADISKFHIWKAPRDFQLRVRGCIESGYLEAAKVSHALSLARRGVEAAIERSEQAAFDILGVVNGR